MCDCYLAKCVECSVGIQMHIGDFSAEREDVKVYCPRCTKTIDGIELFKDTQIFIDQVTRKDQVEGDLFEKGDVVLIICTDLDGHDIHLN